MGIAASDDGPMDSKAPHRQVCTNGDRIASRIRFTAEATRPRSRSSPAAPNWRSQPPPSWRGLQTTSRRWCSIKAPFLQPAWGLLSTPIRNSPGRSKRHRLFDQRHDPRGVNGRLPIAGPNGVFGLGGALFRLDQFDHRRDQVVRRGWRRNPGRSRRQRQD